MKEKKLNEDRDFRIAIIIALIAAILCLSIGYASYSTLLQVDTISEIPSNWLIKFDEISEGTKVGSAKEIAAPILSSTMIKLNVELASPGDSIFYTFKIVNDGNIDAKLNAIPSITGIADDLKDKLISNITYADGTAMNAGDVLATKTTKLAMVKISYKDGVVISPQQINTSILMLYVQN